MSPSDVYDIIMATMFGLILPFGMTGLILYARARARRIEREGAQVDPELVAEMDQLRVRLSDVEERLDFAERMLAHHGERPELPAPGRD